VFLPKTGLLEQLIGVQRSSHARPAPRARAGGPDERARGGMLEQLARSACSPFRDDWTPRVRSRWPC